MSIRTEQLNLRCMSEDREQTLTVKINCELYERVIDWGQTNGYLMGEDVDGDMATIIYRLLSRGLEKAK